jgi:hypothetical protein
LATAASAAPAALAATAAGLSPSAASSAAGEFTAAGVALLPRSGEKKLLMDFRPAEAAPALAPEVPAALTGADGVTRALGAVAAAPPGATAAARAALHDRQ